MGVFDLVQTRSACSDSLLLLLKGKVFTSSFFDTCLPLAVGVQNVKGVKLG